MTIECSGTAVVADPETGEEFDIEADELVWDAVGGSDRLMGPETHYQASIEHESLGTLTWNLWEYPVGIENMQSTDVGANTLVQDFTYGLEHEETRDDGNFDFEGASADEEEEDLKRLDREDRINHMVEWFLSMFEDPQNQTPYAIDKESPYNYEYIWGGPYDASEQIGDNFSYVASDDEIEAAVKIVQDKDGIIEWAPSRNHPDMRRRDDDASTEREAEQPSLGDLRKLISEGARPKFGSDDETSAKADLLAVLEELKPLVARASPTPAHGGIGHNHPPNEMVLPANISVVVTNNITILQNELESEEPDIEAVVESAGVFQTVKEEITDFLVMTKNQVKSQGSKALAAAIIAGVTTVGILAVKWLATAIKGLPPLF